jgi:hypothetical protein
MQWLNESIAWLSALSPEAAFFFSLPFLVAAGALLADLVRKRSGRAGKSASLRKWHHGSPR